MKVNELEKIGIPRFLIDFYLSKKIVKLNPVQTKSIKAGLTQGKSLIICSPTASGKTEIATMAICKNLTKDKGSKAVYLVPLKALASEKYKYYKDLFKKTNLRVIMSTGDLDSVSSKLGEYDLLILTVEKCDSLIRHKAPWIRMVKTVIIDEIHLLNDPGRGPTLEVLITILRGMLKNLQLIALSATIGNPEELAEWLDAELVMDDWRPVKLYKGVYLEGEVEFK